MRRKYSLLLIFFFIVTGLLTNISSGEVSQMKQLDKEIKVQIKPVAFNEPLPAYYKKIFSDETPEEMEKIIKEAGDRSRSHNFLLVSEICQNIAMNLSSAPISLVEKDPEIIIEVSVTKTGVDSLYGPKLIADTVTYKGISNDKVVFKGEFKQNHKGWSSLTTSIKKPKEIGYILSKKISKEIKNLEEKRKSEGRRGQPLE